VSAVIFSIYFFGFGLVLQELGVNLTAYLASATVIGLAISFGSKGLVQDIVIGLTLIFSDAMEVGDLVHWDPQQPLHPLQSLIYCPDHRGHNLVTIFVNLLSWFESP
jgi:Ca2+/Na+ antiporter